MAEPQYLMLNERRKAKVPALWIEPPATGRDATGILQSALTQSAGGRPVEIMPGSYTVAGRLTAPANTLLRLVNGPVITWASTAATGSTLDGVATRPGIEVTGDNFWLEGQGVLRGPSVATYVATEIAIWAKGTSTGARKSGITILGKIEFYDWGRAGVMAQFVDRVRMRYVNIHDVAYSGTELLSCGNIRIRDSEFHDIAPGDATPNGYGIAMTHLSASYSGGRSATNPFCNDIVIEGNTVYNVDYWQGIDCHGAWDATIANNKVYNCRHGISCSGSSGDATNFAGANNTIAGNYVTTLKRTGAATSVSATDRVGINISGGSSDPHKNAVCADNTIEGYGDTTPTSDSIRAVYTFGVIANNHINTWKGRGIYTSNGEGQIFGNQFGAAASATNATCVYLDTTAGTWEVDGNRHHPQSGTAANEGVRINDASNPRIRLRGNDFSYATTPYANFTGTQTREDAQIVPVFNVTTAPTTVDVAAAGLAPRVRITWNPSGISTVTDFPNAHVGQIIENEFPTATATTIDRTNSALSGGANFVSSQYDALVLRCIATSGTKFIELSRGVNA